MKIRKSFTFRSGHIVRNCSSERCRKSLHNHTYTIEVFFEADKLDNGHMIMDFGLGKKNIRDFIKAFDNCWQMWDKESSEFKNDIKSVSDRWIEMPSSPSAEQYSLLFLYVIDQIIKATEFNNGESNVTVHSVQVHETTTGYAQATMEDLKMINYNIDNIILSDAVKKGFSDPLMFDKLKEFTRTGIKCFINPIITQQVV